MQVDWPNADLTLKMRVTWHVWSWHHDYVPVRGSPPICNAAIMLCLRFSWRLVDCEVRKLCYFLDTCHGHLAMTCKMCLPNTAIVSCPTSFRQHPLSSMLATAASLSKLLAWQSIAPPIQLTHEDLSTNRWHWQMQCTIYISSLTLCACARVTIVIQCV